MRHVIELFLGLQMAIVLAVAALYRRFTPRTRKSIVGVAITIALVCALFSLVAPAGRGEDGARVSSSRTLIFHHHYVTAEESAPPYVLPLVIAAGCLVFALGVRFSAPARAPVDGARVQLVATALVVLRFAVEKAGANEPFAHAFGVMWLAPALGIRAALAVPEQPLRFAPLFRFALLSRIPVIVATLLATWLDLGSHFSLARIARIEIPFVEVRLLCEPLDPKQIALLIAVPQLVVWPALMALAALAIGRSWRAYQR